MTNEVAEETINYPEIIRELQDAVKIAQANELGMARMLVEYLVKERDSLRGALSNE